MASLIRPALQLMVKDGGSQNLFCVEYGVFSGDLCTVDGSLTHFASRVTSIFMHTTCSRPQ